MDSYGNVGNKRNASRLGIDNFKGNDSIVKSTKNILSIMFKELGKSYVQLYVELKKLVKENLYKAIRTVCIGVAAFAVCVGLAFGVLYLMGTYNKYVFSTENWNTYTSDRINMIESMESTYNITGMSQKKVEKLLGKPSYETSKKDCEYIALSEVEFDKLVEYKLNSDSKSIADIIEKNYVIAYKNDKVVYADVLIADKIGKQDR